MNILQKVSLFGGVLLLLPFFVSAQVLSGFGLKPGQPRAEEPRSESIFIHTLEPGASVVESVLVVNNKKEADRFVVYAADTTPSSGGGFACKQLSQDKTDVGGWVDFVLTDIADGNIIVLAPNVFEISVPSGTNLEIPLTINVPESAEVGEYSGCLLIEEVQPEFIKTAGANLSIRTGSRISITVPGEIIKDVTAVNYSVTKSSKLKYNLTPVVRNNGNVSSEIDIDIATKGLMGRVLGSGGGLFTVLRGEEAEWNFELRRPMLGSIASSRFSYTFDDVNGQQVAVVGGTQNFFMAPTAVGILIYLGALVFIGYIILVFRMRRKQKAWINDNWTEVTVQDGDTLVALSGRVNVNWKIVAKVNNIEPPYNLEPGQRIKLPM